MTDNDTKDNVLSGFYLVTSLHHMITRESHKTNMEISKESFDKDLYKELLKSFILHKNKDFDFSKLKHGIESMESIVQKDFVDFCNYAINLKRNNNLPFSEKS
jgi:hypothetical protein